jgi:hypothetical protein
MSRLLVIPDIQAKPGQDMSHLDAIGQFIAEKKFDAIVQLGDLWDFPSLSSYDRGKKAAEGRRLNEDWDAGCEAILRVMAPWHGSYSPDLIYVAGNHEYRVDRHEEEYPALAGSLPDYLGFMEGLGWDSYPFLTPVIYEGITFCHFFPKNSKGGVSAASSRNGAASAMAQLRNNMRSCIAGHKQGYDSATFPTASGRLRSEIVGSYYQHDEAYMGPHGNDYWRGCLVLNQLDGKGDYDKTEVSLSYLMDTYIP